MTFDDLHIMQQAALINDYLDKPLKLKPVPNAIYYTDRTNDVVINVSRLRTHCKHIWLPSLVKGIFITFEADDFNIATKATIKFASLSKETLNVNTHKLFDTYGLISHSVITGDIVKSLSTIKTILIPFTELGSVEENAIKSIDLMLATIVKIKKLPDSFFDEIKIDVGLQIVVRKFAIVTHYDVLTNKVTPSKRVPDVQRLNEHSLRIYFEDSTKPQMIVTMGENGPDIKVQLIPTNGDYEGGMFHVVAKPTIAEIGTDIIQTITDIVNDCTFADELQPHLRRYLRHFKPSVKHVKNANRL